jgi:hypothetical protein
MMLNLTGSAKGGPFNGERDDRQELLAGEPEMAALQHYKIPLITAVLAFGAAGFDASAQQSACAKRTTVSALRSTFIAPEKSQFETEAEYRARLRRVPQNTFLIRVAPVTCGTRNTSLTYDAEEGKVVLRLLGERRIFGENRGASTSFDFPHLDSFSSEEDELVVWESCTARDAGDVRMSSAFGATVTVKQTIIAGTGVLVPRAVRGSGNQIWTFKELMNRDAARKLIGRLGSLQTEVEICLVPDNDGKITVTATENIYPELSNPKRQVLTLQMVRGSIRAVHLRDPSTARPVLSFPLNIYCDSDALGDLVARS